VSGKKDLIPEGREVRRVLNSYNPVGTGNLTGGWDILESPTPRSSFWDLSGFGVEPTKLRLEFGRFVL
jgi:hypothetical protein